MLWLLVIKCRGTETALAFALELKNLRKIAWLIKQQKLQRNGSFSLFILQTPYKVYWNNVIIKYVMLIIFLIYQFISYYYDQ
jgi:hypothetical protein